ncbi:hypothetical protein SH2C18_16770 [Clostridium sediminicola]
MGTRLFMPLSEFFLASIVIFFSGAAAGIFVYIKIKNYFKWRP